MPNSGHNALFYGPRIRSAAKHLQVVVGFQNEAVAAAQLVADVGRQEAEIGGEGQANAFGDEAEADRIGGVVREW